MELSDGEWGHLLGLAREQAGERLVGTPHLVDDVVLLVERKMRDAMHTPERHELDAYVKRSVTHEIAAHFRRMNANARAAAVISPTKLSDFDAFLWFVGALEASTAAQRRVWRDIADELEPHQRKLIRFMADGMRQSDLAPRLGYANAAVVKVTVNRLRNRLRKEFAARSA